MASDQVWVVAACFNEAEVISTFIDPIPALCGAGCTLDSMRHLLFDDDHLSAQAAQLLLTPVLSELSKAQS